MRKKYDAEMMVKISQAPWTQEAEQTSPIMNPKNLLSDRSQTQSFGH
jgi:hypothetical protein